MVTFNSPGPVAAGEPRAALPWHAQIEDAYLAGTAHAFLLDGDVEGTAVEDLSVRWFLRDTLLASCEVVAWYQLGAPIAIVAPDQLVQPGPGQLRRDRYAETRTRRALALDILGAEEAAPAPAPSGAVGGLAARFAPQGGPPADPFAEADNPATALALLGRLLREGTPTGDEDDLGDGRVAIVVDYADLLAPAPVMGGAGGMSPEDRLVLATLLAWAKDPAIAANGNRVYLLCRDAADLHPALRAGDGGWLAVTIPLPDRERRGDYLAWYLDRRERLGRPIALLDALTVAELTNLTAGLSLRNVEDVLLAAARAGGLTRAALKAHKDRIVTSQYSDIAELVDPLPGGFADLGGMEQVKAWAREFVIRPLLEGRRRDAIRALLLAGPPGTGKTQFARALAGEVGMPVVKLDASKVMGGIVGETEKKLARFGAFARAIAPCFVFLDEVDQGDFGQRGNGSGNPVAASVFSWSLQFLGDESLRGLVTTILATNRPDLLDDAFKRNGRVDAIVPLLMPDAAQRRGIALAQARAQEMPMADEAADFLAERCVDYSAADLAAVVRKARLKAGARGSRQIGLEDAREAQRALRPSSVATAAWYTDLAIQACGDADLLPPEYAASLNDRSALEERIAERAPATETPFVRGERKARDSRR